MEKVLDNKIYLLCMFLLFCCKQKTNDSTQNNNNYNSTIVSDKENVLDNKTEELCFKDKKPRDILLFKKSMRELIINKDTLELVKKMKFPYFSSGIETDKEGFLSGEDIDIISSYFIKETIRDDLQTEFQPKEFFEKIPNTDCYQYVIENNFPDSEFSVIFHLEKDDNGKIKISYIYLAG